MFTLPAGWPRTIHKLRRGAMMTASITALGLPSNVYAQIVGDGTTATTITQSGSRITITDGTRAGNNLFHSFSDFNIDFDETAIFEGEASIENVINRITGSNPSLLQGLMRSNVGNADFYFINPNGVIFGGAARVDVPGALHISTADEVEFSDGQVMDVSSISMSSFASAPPEAFGFYNDNSGTILIDRNFLPDGESGRAFVLPETTSLSASRIEINQQRVDTSGEVDLTLTAIGSGANRLSIRSGDADGVLTGELVLTNAARLTAENLSANGSSLRLQGGTVEISGNSRLHAVNEYESPTTIDGTASLLSVSAAVLNVLDASQIASFNFADGNAIADIVVAAEEINVLSLDGNGRSTISSTTNGVGRSGDISLTADRMNFHIASVSSSSSGDGDSGAVSFLVSDSFDAHQARFVSQSRSTDDTGGSAGSISFIGDYGATMTLTGIPGSTTVINADVFGGTQDTATANITIDGFRTVHLDGAEFTSRTRGKANAGDITINVGESLSIVGSSLISRSELRGSSFDFLHPDDLGGAGRIRLSTSSDAAGTTLTSDEGSVGRSFISVSTASNRTTTEPGLIQLTGFDTVDLSGLAFSSRTEGAAHASAIEIDARTALTLNEVRMFGQSDPNLTYTTREDAGDPGTISFTGDGTTTMSAQGIVSDLDVDGLGFITTRATGGTSDTPQSEVRFSGFESVSLSDAEISATSSGDAQAGAIVINASNEINLNNTFLSSSTSGNGDAGAISLSADTINATSGSISTEASEGSTGAGGRISLTGRSVSVDGGFEMTAATAGSGDAGKIILTASEEISIQGSGTTISSQALTADGGAAGTILIDCALGQIHITDGALVTTSSAQSTAQSSVSGVTLIADRILISGTDGKDGTGSTVSSSASGTGGDAGRVQIESHSLEILDGGKVTTNSLLGEAGDILISVQPNGLLELRGGQIVTTAEAGSGSGGRITIGTPLALIIEGGTIEALGETAGANVAVEAAFFIEAFQPASRVEVAGALNVRAQLGNVTAAAAPIEAGFIDAGSALQQICALERRKGQTNALSSLVDGPQPSRKATKIDPRLLQQLVN